MARLRYLKNAPISEALFDIRVKLPKNFDVSKFKSLGTELGGNYPIIEEQHLFSGHHHLVHGKHQSSSLRDEVNGYFFKSKDLKDIVQFRRDGFTVNRLHPYTNWDELVQKTKNLWPIYHKVADPEAVTRLAVRYINQLKILLPIADFSEYLAVPPVVPSGLPQGIATFFNRVTIYYASQDIHANITQSLENVDPIQLNDRNHIVIILDIDVFKQCDLLNNDQEIWPNFDQFHNIKNEIFFNYITEKTAELFE